VISQSLGMGYLENLRLRQASRMQKQVLRENTLGRPMEQCVILFLCGARAC